MDHPLVTGHYRAQTFTFSIVEKGGRLFIAQPSIPDEYHPELRWAGASRLMVESGPMSGSTVDIDEEDGVAIGGMVNGTLPIERVETPPEPTPGEGLRAPDYADEPERDAVFESVWASHAPGAALDVPQPYEAHELVRWLMGKDSYIFHGSKRSDIEVFEPRRTSVELMNYSGHGNLGAVYGTHDGLWAMFFAVVDRSRIEGSIRNGVATYRSSVSGESVDLYRFSVSATSLPDHPFGPGALYVLPRDTFERIRFGESGPFTNEWASREPVAPLAVMQLQPEDFPFIDLVGGHDDSLLIRLNEVGARLFAGLRSARRIEGGFRLTIGPDLEREVLEEWLELGRIFFPDVTRTLVDRETVELLGPEAVIQTLETRLGDLLEETSQAARSTRDSG